MSSSRPCLLIVEDNRLLAENVAEILDECGFETLIAATAEEALAVATGVKLAGVITDLRLPGMSGTELISELRARGVAAPVVVVTAFADAMDLQEAERAGALDVLPKPIDFQRLFRLTGEFVTSDRPVLVLEDAASLADNVADALREHQMEIIVSATIRGALGHRRLPRVAIIDLKLPDGDGLDAARVLLARDPEIRVFLTTGHPELLERGADLPNIEHPVLQKPVKLDALVARVEELASKCRDSSR